LWCKQSIFSIISVISSVKKFQEKYSFPQKWTGHEINSTNLPRAEKNLKEFYYSTAKNTGRGSKYVSVGTIHARLSIAEPSCKYRKGLESGAKYEKI